MDHSAFVSVVIPTYQRAHLVGQAIESVLAQSYRDYEIIVVNDGSTDDTATRLSEFADRIRVIHQANRGVSAARNAGIQVAKGDLLAFLDDDDLWLPGKLASQVALFARNSAVGLVYGDMKLFDEAGERQGSYVDRCPPPLMQNAAVLFCYNFIPNSTVMVRRACLDQVGLFDESLPPCEDYDLWLRIIEHWPVLGSSEVLTRYRLSANGLHCDKGKALLNVLRVKEKAFARNQAIQRLPSSWLDQCFYDLYLQLARWHQATGNAAQAQAVLAHYRERRGETDDFRAVADSLRNDATDA